MAEDAKNFKNKKEAYEFATDQSSLSIASNNNNTPYRSNIKGFNVDTVYLSYVKYLYQEKYAYSTRRNRESLLKLFLDEIKVDDVRKITIKETDSYLRKRSSVLTEHSLNTDKRVIRSFFCYLEEHLDVQLTFNYRKALREKDPGQVIRKTISLERMRAIVSRMDNDQDKLMASLLFESAMRIDELANVRAENINGHYVKIRGKGGRVGTVFITDELAKRLREYMIDNKIFSGPLFRHSEKYCSKHCAIKSGAYHNDTIRKRLTRQLKKQGIRGITPHSLRRSFATDFYKRSKDIKATQRILRHKKVETTEAYIQIPDLYAERMYFQYVPATVYS